MQLLSQIEIEQVSGAMVVDINDVPPGVYIDIYGNPWTSTGIPLF